MKITPVPINISYFDYYLSNEAALNTLSIVIITIKFIYYRKGVVLLKEKCIHNLHQARTSHIRLLNSLKLLVSGLSVDENKFKSHLSETEFGKWFYEEAMLFSMGNSRLSLDEIENTLLKFNDSFTKIYQIYFDNKASGLGGMFGLKKKASNAEVELAQRLYEEMVVLSDRLKQKLRVFESQLSSMPEEKFTDKIFISTDEPKAQETVIQEDSGTQYQFGARGH